MGLAELYLGQLPDKKICIPITKPKKLQSCIVTYIVIIIWILIIYEYSIKYKFQGLSKQNLFIASNIFKIKYVTIYFTLKTVKKFDRELYNSYSIMACQPTFGSFPLTMERG